MKHSEQVTCVRKLIVTFS